MGHDKQDILSQFIDKRVSISGYFEKHSTVTRSNGQIHTSLFQDVYLEPERGVEIDLGHAWIQFTDELKRFDLMPGTKLKCTCRVKQYKKYQDYPGRVLSGGGGMQYEFRYSLSYPANVEILSPVEASAAKSPLIPASIAAAVIKHEVEDENENEPVKQSPGPGKKFCPNCSERIPIASRHCPTCGTATPTKTKTAETSQPKYVPASQPTFTPQPVERSTGEGVDKLVALQSLLKATGGVGPTREFLSLVDAFGGTGEVRRFLSLL